MTSDVELRSGPYLPCNHLHDHHITVTYCFKAFNAPYLLKDKFWSPEHVSQGSLWWMLSNFFFPMRSWIFAAIHCVLHSPTNSQRSISLYFIFYFYFFSDCKTFSNMPTASTHLWNYSYHCSWAFSAMFGAITLSSAFLYCYYVIYHTLPI